MTEVVAQVLGWGVVGGSLALIVYCPILKPWFGFRKPAGHPGRWFQ